MRIALDACGGDFGLKPNVEGAVQAASELGCEVHLVGPGGPLAAELKALGIGPGDRRFVIVEAAQSVGMGEDPVRACREKPQASILVAAELAARGRVDAVVSCGHSGATMVAALWHMKRIPGVLRPAIACPIPTQRGISVLLDGGANADCKPWHLVQFAMMGAFYARHVFKAERPSVGLLSIGEEEDKGNELVREAARLLRSSGLNFHGMVEGRDIPSGAVDVVVCDGFVGNVCLKLMEGTASSLFAMLKTEIERGLFSKLGGALIRPAARRLRKRLSYDEYGGAPLLGVDGTAIICHGKSNAKAVFNAHRVAQELTRADTNQHIRAAMARLKASMEMAQVAE